jgi:hypothetical protein
MSDERPAALASELRRRGLDAPALLLLHAHRPLRPLLAELAVFLSPISRPFAGRAMHDLTASVRSDAAYDRLIEDLEDEGSEAAP